MRHDYSIFGKENLCLINLVNEIPNEDTSSYKIQSSQYYHKASYCPTLEYNCNRYGVGGLMGGNIVIPGCLLSILGQSSKMKLKFKCMDDDGDAGGGWG